MPAPLAPVTRTRTAQRITRSGLTPHREVWGAKTADGVWGIDREDSPGTPWLIYHLPSVADGSWAKPVMETGSLRAARLAIGSGQAGRELAMHKCPHPAAARGTRPGGPNWCHETCSACGASRSLHRAGCRDCQDYRDGTGAGHEWIAAQDRGAAA